MTPGGGHDVIAPAPGSQPSTTPTQEHFSTTVSLASSPVPAPVVTDPAVSADAPGRPAHRFLLAPVFPTWVLLPAHRFLLTPP